MSEEQAPYHTARLKAIRALEKDGADAYLPANAWGLDLSALDRAGLSPRVKGNYMRALRALMNAGLAPTDLAGLQRYALPLRAHRRASLKFALRLTLVDPNQPQDANIDLETIPVLQALITSLEELQKAEKSPAPEKAKKNARLPIYLSPSQVRQITALCPNTIEGQRDWIILSLCLGAGLRREEVIDITFDALQQRQTKNGDMQDILHIQGRQIKERDIPISPLLANRLRAWRAIAGDGLIARSYGPKKVLRTRMARDTVWKIVRKYGKRLGFPALSPDDLRHTYARLAYDAGVPPTVIMELLGQGDIATTYRYIGLEVDFDGVTGEFVPLSSK